MTAIHNVSSASVKVRNLICTKLEAFQMPSMPEAA